MKLLLADGLSLRAVADRAHLGFAGIRKHATSWLRDHGVESSGLATAVLTAAPDTRLALWCTLDPSHEPGELGADFVQHIGVTYIDNPQYWQLDWLFNHQLDGRRKAIALVLAHASSASLSDRSTSDFMSDPTLGFSNANLLSALRPIPTNDVYSFSCPTGFLRDGQAMPAHPPTLHRAEPSWRGNKGNEVRTVTAMPCPWCTEAGLHRAWASLVMPSPEVLRLGSAVLCPACRRTPKSQIVFPQSVVTDYLLRQPGKGPAAERFKVPAPRH